jgi:glycerol-3-phosphate dehydrogenase
MSDKIICRCRKIKESEIRDSIRRPVGARTVNGVKRRTNACTGRCQGGYCLEQITKIIAEELQIPIEQVLLENEGSWIIKQN